MKRLIALLLLVAAVLIVVTGLILVSKVPVGGLIFVAIGLAVGGFAFWLDHGRARAEKEHFQAATRAAETASQLEANARHGGLLLIAAFLALLFLASAWLAARKGDIGAACGFGALTIVFFYLGWHALRLSMQPGPTMSLDMRGLRHVQYGAMPWQEIVGVSLRQVQVKSTTVSTLIVGVRQPHRFVHGLPWIARWRYRNWKPNAPATGEIEIPLGNLNQKPEVIHVAAQAMLKRHNPDALAHWYPGMDTRDIDTLAKMEQLTRKLESLSQSTGAFPEAETASITAQMQQLEPALRQVGERRLGHARKLRNQARVWLVVGVVLLALWIAAKFF